jgi:hypothetical protein
VTLLYRFDLGGSFECAQPVSGFEGESALTWGDGRLWVGSATELGRVVAFDTSSPCGPWPIDSLRSFTFPDLSYIRFLEWDGENLLVADFSSVYRISIQGALLSNTSLPSACTFAVAWGYGSLWIVNTGFYSSERWGRARYGEFYFESPVLSRFTLPESGASPN